MLFLTHIVDISIKISEMHNKKALMWIFYMHMHVKNHEKWKLFMLLHIKTHFEDFFKSLHQKLVKVDLFDVITWKVEFLCLCIKKVRYVYKICKWLQKVRFWRLTHFKICNELQKVRLCLKTYFKTCIGLKKVRFCLITCFKICNEHKNVLLCEENMFLLQKPPILLITFDFLHGFEWNQLHSSCFGEVIILPP